MHEKIIAPAKARKPAICTDNNKENLIRIITEHKIKLIKELTEKEPAMQNRLSDISTGVPESLIQSIVCDVGMISDVLGIKIMERKDAGRIAKAT